MRLAPIMAGNMTTSISTTQANRKFSQLLREVREGRTYVVASKGRPVVRVVPISANGRARAKEILLKRLRSQPTIDIGRWTRDELYD